MGISVGAGFALLLLVITTIIACLLYRRREQKQRKAYGTPTPIAEKFPSNSTPTSGTSIFVAAGKRKRRNRLLDIWKTGAALLAENDTGEQDGSGERFVEQENARAVLIPKGETSMDGFVSSFSGTVLDDVAEGRENWASGRVRDSQVGRAL